MWDSYKKGFKAYLQLEKSLADNSVEAYLNDLEKLTVYLQANGALLNPGDITLKQLEQFVQWAASLGLTAASQARMISGIRQFYKFCTIENIVKSDPTILLEAPKLKRALPDVLSFEEIEGMINSIE